MEKEEEEENPLDRRRRWLCRMVAVFRPREPSPWTVCVCVG